MSSETNPPSFTTAEMRVIDAIEKHKLNTQVVVLEQLATTAQMAADALRVEVGQIVKSLCFKGKDSGKALMLLVSGANRVHEARAGRLIGEKLSRADADFVKEQTGFSIGGVSPFGHPAPLAIYIDEDLLTFTTIWAAAGNPRSVFELAPDDLVRCTGGKTICVK